MTLSQDMIGSMSVGRGRGVPRDFGTLQRLPDPVVAIEARFDTGFTWNMHHHDRGQLILVVANPAEVVTQAHHWRLVAGQAVWLPGGIEHGVASQHAPHLRSLYIRPDVAARLPREPAMLRVSPFLSELSRRISDLFNGEGDPALYPHLVMLALAEILGSPGPLPDLPMPPDRRLATICGRLQSHPGDRRTLAEWGVAVGASCRTLERLFRQETGMGFGEWRQLCRIREALPMLRRGIPVQVVAWQVGYDSPSAFAVAFRKVSGESPSAFHPVD